MDVPQNLPKINTNTKNSTKSSYDGGHILKIRRNRRTTGTPIQTHHQPHIFNKTFEASLGGFGNSSERDQSKALNTVEYFNGLRRLLNSSHWSSGDISRFYSPPLVYYKQPVIKVPKVEVPVKQKNIPLSTLLWVGITFIICLVICVLKIYAYARSSPSEERRIRRQIPEEYDLSTQEQNNGDRPFSLSVNSEYSPQNHNHSDFRPTYFECAASNDGIINKSFTANSEELAPSYSICLETLSNTDEAPTES